MTDIAIIKEGNIPSYEARNNRCRMKNATTSSIFNELRKYVNQRYKTYYILSSEFGLVHPEQFIDPLQEEALYYRDYESWVEKTQSDFDELDCENLDILVNREYLQDIDLSDFNVNFPVGQFEDIESIEKLKNSDTDALSW